MLPPRLFACSEFWIKTPIHLHFPTLLNRKVLFHIHKYRQKSHRGVIPCSSPLFSVHYVYPVPHLLLLFLAGNRTGTESRGLWAPSPWLALCVGVTVSETPSLYGEMGSRSLLSCPETVSCPVLPLASGLSCRALWADLRAWAQTGLGDLPRLSDSAGL